MKSKKKAVTKKPGKTAQGRPYEVGQAYLIRTATHYYTGRLTWVGPQELILDDAAWVADTGRYHVAIITGELSEVEPIEGTCIVGRGAIVDAVEWHHALPMTAKRSEYCINAFGLPPELEPEL